MLAFIRGSYEVVALAVTILYGLFILHFLFPGTYRKLLDALARLWSQLVSRVERSDETERLNRLWDAGGTDG